MLYQYGIYTELVSLFGYVGSLTGRNGKGIYVYFVANFSEELISFGTWNDGHLSIKSVFTVGKRCGAFAGNVFNYKEKICYYCVDHTRV